MPPKRLRIRTVAEFDLQRAISIAADQMPDYRGFREEEQKRCLELVKMTFQRNQLRRKKKKAFLAGVERKSSCSVFVLVFENICEILETEI